ncbi:MAG: hypothetical protein Q8R92_07200 [Deltaproteobacteria bacterium]|nr:hypothetical protein [Deltaproteobacteria bacterium]
MPNDTQSVDLVRLAATLTTAQVNKMAHALGWPDTLNIGRRSGRIKWRNPYRNGWSGAALDPDWTAAEVAGLAVSRPPYETHPYTTWSVTSAGQAAVMLRLRARLEVQYLDAIKTSATS